MILGLLAEVAPATDPIAAVIAGIFAVVMTTLNGVQTKQLAGLREDNSAQAVQLAGLRDDFHRYRDDQAARMDEFEDRLERVEEATDPSDPPTPRRRQRTASHTTTRGRRPQTRKTTRRP